MTNLYKFQGVETTTTMQDNELLGIYRGTTVAKKFNNIITLNTGGWKSRTTKVRMNQFSHNFCDSKFSVYQKNYDWFVNIGSEVLKFENNTITFVI